MRVKLTRTVGLASPNGGAGFIGTEVQTSVVDMADGSPMPLGAIGVDPGTPVSGWVALATPIAAPAAAAVATEGTN